MIKRYAGKRPARNLLKTNFQNMFCCSSGRQPVIYWKPISKTSFIAVRWAGRKPVENKFPNQYTLRITRTSDIQFDPTPCSSNQVFLLLHLLYCTYGWCFPKLDDYSPGYWRFLLHGVPSTTSTRSVCVCVCLCVSVCVCALECPVSFFQVAWPETSFSRCMSW